MKRIIFLCMLLGAIFSSVLAQESVLEPGEQDQFNYNKVMIIPYNPLYYLSDSDHDLEKYNNRKAEDIRRLFRHGLNYNVNLRILGKYETITLLSDTAMDVQQDLKAIYNGISYHMDRPMSAFQPEEEGKVQKVWSGFKEKVNDVKAEYNYQETDYSTYNTEEDKKVGGYIKSTKETKYMNVKIYNPDMLLYLSEKYDTDLFVFINQFELKTNYLNCLDRTINRFDREVWVHFSIYDKNSNQLVGDVVKVYFPMNTNNIDEIIKNNFPLISNYIMESLPQQEMMVTE